MRRLNKICALADWSDAELLEMMAEVHRPLPVVQHRKLWEWAIGMLSLKKLGKLNQDSLALGIGCGSERPPFYLSNIIRYVFCTDLYITSNWSEANLDMLIDPAKVAPFKFNRRRLGVQIMMEHRSILKTIFSISSLAIQQSNILEARMLR